MKEANICLKSPEDLLAEDAFLALIGKGFNVAHLSDYVRLLAIEAGGATAWLLDCDQLWLKAPPACHASAYGHMFGSMSAGRQWIAGIKAAYLHWQLHYLRSFT